MNENPAYYSATPETGSEFYISHLRLGDQKLKPPGRKTGGTGRECKSNPASFLFFLSRESLHSFVSGASLEFARLDNFSTVPILEVAGQD